MYADHMNDHLYGLMVPRDYNGNLVSALGYKLFKTKGNGNEYYPSNGFTTGCDIRRINVIYVKPYSTSNTYFYWRPLSINYYQKYNTAN
jgi:hypothetical protein